MSASKADILAKLDTLSHQELKRYLVHELTNKKLGLSWESDLIDREKAINCKVIMKLVTKRRSRLHLSVID
jgi:adenine-specific DNA-methyltransferase